MEQDRLSVGLFTARISADDGRIAVVLTGDHYAANESDAVAALQRKEQGVALAHDASPLYLIRDTGVRLAVDARRRVLQHGFEGCHDGRRNRPCGTCVACTRAKVNAQTRVLLSKIELPDDSLAQRLRAALGSVIGLNWIDAPWEVELTQPEINKLLKEIGISQENKGEKDNEAHQDHT